MKAVWFFPARKVISTELVPLCAIVDTTLMVAPAAFIASGVQFESRVVLPSNPSQKTAAAGHPAAPPSPEGPVDPSPVLVDASATGPVVVPVPVPVGPLLLAALLLALLPVSVPVSTPVGRPVSAALLAALLPVFVPVFEPVLAGLEVALLLVLVSVEVDEFPVVPPLQAAITLQATALPTKPSASVWPKPLRGEFMVGVPRGWR
jgi:hypothetical protein